MQTSLNTVEISNTFSYFKTLILPFSPRYKLNLKLKQKIRYAALKYLTM